MNRDQYSAKFKFHSGVIGSNREQHVGMNQRKNDAPQSDTEEQVSDWQDPSAEYSGRSLDRSSRNPQC